MARALGWSVCLLLGSAVFGAQLPEISLGYATHRATSENARKYFTFSNIRYAAPPLGDYRFRAPIAPHENHSAVQDGSVGFTCPQSQPAWWATIFATRPELVKAIPVDTHTSQQNEDCLFLDVVTPSKNFKDGELVNGTALSPVLIWIHGGGYFLGDKSTLYDPAGFFHQSKDDIVYVSMNYRLGAFGFLSGTNQNPATSLESQTSANGTSPNAGLLDQQASFSWVESHIQQFGGDPNKITVFGQSAGGGSVMHHMTWLGGIYPKQGIGIQKFLAQSPSPNIVTKTTQKRSFERFLRATNASNVAQLRKLPPNSSLLLEANALVALDAPFSTLNFGPSVDGYYVPDLPVKLLAQGKFNNTLKVMASHNPNDGLIYTPANITTNADYDAMLRLTNPSSPQSALDHISQVLYPPIYDGSQPYTDVQGRAGLTLGEERLICNPLYLASAFRNASYTYIFSVPPGFHSEDLSYSFFNGYAEQTPRTNLTIGNYLSAYITNFARKGDPNGKGLPKFPMFGRNASSLNLTADHGAVPVRDPTANERCKWWALGLTYGDDL